MEEKVDGTGEAGGTGVEAEAEKDWEGKRTGVEGGSFLSDYNPITRSHGSDFLPRNLVFPNSTEGLKQLVTRNLHFRGVHVNKYRGDGG